MKFLKLKALILFYISIYSLSVLQGCWCVDEERYTGVGQLEAYLPKDKDVNQIVISDPSVYIDSVNGEFYLEQGFEYRIEQASLNEMSLISSTYATTCGSEQVNDLDLSSFSLTIDKQFIYKNDTIKPGVNLLNISEIQQSSSNPFGLVYFMFFTSDFLTNSVFQKDNYTFTFSGKTTNNISIVSQKELYFRL
jgi:hypothetical protein